MKDVIQMTIRLEPDFHAECKESADYYGQTLGEWIRRAMKEKLDRHNNPNIKDDELDARIEKILRKILAESKQS